MIKRISNIILSFILLLTTTGLTINIHYCSGNLYSFAIDSEADNCCEGMNHMNYSNNKSLNVQCHADEPKNDYCDNETVIVKINDYFTTTTENININTNNVIILYTLLSDTYNFFVSSNTTNILNYNNFQPYSRQILSLFQSFLL